MQLATSHSSFLASPTCKEAAIIGLLHGMATRNTED